MRRAAVEETALGDASKPFGSGDDLVSRKVANYIYTSQPEISDFLIVSLVNAKPLYDVVFYYIYIIICNMIFYFFIIYNFCSRSD